MTVFSRTYAVLLFLLPVSFVLALNIADNLFEEGDRNDFMRDTLVEVKLIQHELDRLLPSQWGEFIATYQPIFDSRITLLSSREVARNPSLKGIDATIPDNWMTRTASLDDWWLLHRLPGGHRYLWIQEDERLDDIPLEDLIVILIPLGVILLLVAVAIGYIYWRIARPIHALSTAACRLAEGELDARAPAESGEPIGDLVTRFNHMASRIEMLVNEQRVLIGAIPHELRSPIGRLRFALDMTRDVTGIKALRKQIETIDGYVDDVDALIKQTLVLTRTRTQPPAKKRFRCNAFIDEVTNRVNPTSKQLCYWCEGLTEITGDPDLIALLTINLLNNALHYAKCRVELKVETISENCHLILVDDDGPGIPVSERQAVFTPFYRLDCSRSRHSGGIGLGLALVALIAERLGGEVMVLDSPLGGARLQFQWCGETISRVTDKNLQKSG